MKILSNFLMAGLFLISCSIVNAQFLPPVCPGDEACGIGGGQNSDAIIVDWPPVGNVANTVQFINWLYKEGATSYTVEIFNADGTVNFYTATATNTSHKLDFPSINLDTDTEYAIVIRSNNNEFSNIIRFTLKDKSERDAVLEALNNDAIYKSLNGIDKSLRKAEFYRINGWNLAAAKAHHINVLSNSAMDYKKILDSFDRLRFLLFNPSAQ